MNVGNDSGPCPRCSGPTEVVSYAEAPWGYRGNYLYRCEICGEFGLQLEVGGVAAPANYIFLKDQYANFDEKTVEIPQHISRRLRVQTMGNVVPSGSETLITTYQEDIPTKINLSPVQEARCHRCGRLVRDCEGGQLGDCIDYKRQ